MLRFRLLGFPITIHWLFWLNCALLSGELDGQTPQAMQRLVIFVAVAFLSVLVHELGHAYTMRSTGDSRVSVLLHAFGGLAQGSRPLTRSQDIMVSAAGPAVQIVAALVVYWLARVFVRGGIGYMGRFALSSFIEVSIVWALLNLLPILPLDGGRICAAVLGPRRIRLTLILSMVFLAALGLWAMWSWQPFMLVVIGMLAFNNFRQLQSVSAGTR
jgi:Zn-dependent protease